jgi:hypothetical protein
MIPDRTQEIQRPSGLGVRWLLRVAPRETRSESIRFASSAAQLYERRLLRSSNRFGDDEWAAEVWVDFSVSGRAHG